MNRRTGAAALLTSLTLAGTAMSGATPALAATPDASPTGDVAASARLSLPPGPPTVLTIKGRGSTRKLYWSAPTSGAESLVGYRVLVEHYTVKKGKKKFSLPKTAIVKRPRYTMTGVVKGYYELIIMGKTATGYGLPLATNLRVK